MPPTAADAPVPVAWPPTQTQCKCACLRYSDADAEQPPWSKDSKPGVRHPGSPPSRTPGPRAPSPTRPPWLKQCWMAKEKNRKEYKEVEQGVQLHGPSVHAFACQIASLRKVPHGRLTASLTIQLGLAKMEAARLFANRQTSSFQCSHERSKYAAASQVRLPALLFLFPHSPHTDAVHCKFPLHLEAMGCATISGMPATGRAITGAGAAT